MAIIIFPLMFIALIYFLSRPNVVENQKRDALKRGAKVYFNAGFYIGCNGTIIGYQPRTLQQTGFWEQIYSREHWIIKLDETNEEVQALLNEIELENEDD